MFDPTRDLGPVRDLDDLERRMDAFEAYLLSGEPVGTRRHTLVGTDGLAVGQEFCRLNHALFHDPTSRLEQFGTYGDGDGRTVHIIRMSARF